MREEIKNWIRQADADLRKAKILFEEKEFDGVAFNSHQSVEKALKALYMSKNKKGKPGHSIIYLARQLKIPRKFLSGLREITPEYLVSRYPDIAGAAPVDLYDEDIVSDYINTAEEILKWVKKQIQE
jgi:HEPN domain-containing protein